MLGRRVDFDEPMARYTSLRVGGPADAFARPANRAELAELLAIAARHGTPVCALGRGFNAIVRDAGLAGIVVQLGALRALERLERERVRAEAGVTHTTLTRFCADEGLAGLEFGVGIPGTVGGWIAMNAGIPEHEMRDVVERVEIFDPLDHEGRELTGEELHWRYRRLELPAQTLVLSATFVLSVDEPAAIRERMREYLDRRLATQPVNEPSCGSVFKNPEGDQAGRLIDAAGLKELRVGGAEISGLHANFIVNRGGATASDVLALIARATEEVETRFGVRLETEVRMLGEVGEA